MKSTVGYNIDFKPNQDCTDKNCPHHGELSVRGKIFEGVVTSSSMNKTVKIEWENLVKDEKYARYYKTKSRVSAHNPSCIKAGKGDRVLIAETRPLSKTKHFAVVKIVASNSGETK